MISLCVLVRAQIDVFTSSCVPVCLCVSMSDTVLKVKKTSWSVIRS